jgi:hypothetical protein
MRWLESGRFRPIKMPEIAVGNPEDSHFRNEKRPGHYYHFAGN